MLRISRQHLALFDHVAVLDQHVDHFAVQIGEDLAARPPAASLPLPVNSKFGRPQEQDQQHHQRRHRRRRSVQGNCRASTTHFDLPMARHTGIRNSSLCSSDVGQRDRAVVADDFDPLRQTLARAAVFDLLDDQRAEHLGLFQRDWSRRAAP